MGADDRRQGWVERLPTIAKVLFVVLILAVAIFLRFSDVVDRRRSVPRSTSTVRPLGYSSNRSGQSTPAV
jgi:hypothetical protein